MAAEGAGESRFTLYAALAANLGIALAKFVAAALSGSSAMLTEGFHSVVDSTNQLLLLYGQKRAQKPPDKIHPLGYGRELYFWSFVVAILIFATGAGLSVYEGVLHILHPEPSTDPTLNYVVLGISAALEGTSGIVALRAFGRQKGDLGWWQAIRRSKDPTVFIVLFEDSAALLGLVIAALGVFLAHALAMPLFDGAASIVIGCVLAAVAFVLARESHGLLIGERADPEMVRAVHDAVDGRPEVTYVHDVLTMHIAPEMIFVGLDVDFEDHVPVGQIEVMIADVEAALRGRFPAIRTLYIKPRSS